MKSLNWRLVKGFGGVSLSGRAMGAILGVWAFSQVKMLSSSLDSGTARYTSTLNRNPCLAPKSSLAMPLGSCMEKLCVYPMLFGWASSPSTL
ncbi:hypothetical protein D3C72_2214820 [compost metagenome]